LIAFTIHAGTLGFILETCFHSPAVSLLRTGFAKNAARCGPKCAIALIASPALEFGIAVCQEGACFRKTFRRPSIRVLALPDVRKSSSTGTCVVGPRSLAALAPLGTIRSPVIFPYELTTFSADGG
jgi:hypothetical protein